MLVSVFACGFVNLLFAQWAGYLVLLAWAVAWVTKISTFPFYFHVRTVPKDVDSSGGKIRRSHSSAMNTASVVGEDKDVRTERIAAEHKEAIAKAAFVIYVTSQCPVCEEATTILKKTGEVFTVVSFDDVTEVEDRNAYQLLLTDGVGGAVFPIIFAQQELVGGVEELKKRLSREGE